MRKVAYLTLGILLIAIGAGVPFTTALIVFILPESFASSVRLIPASTDPVQIARDIEKIQSKAILGQVVTNLSLNKKWGEKMKVGEFPTDLSVSILMRQLTIRQSRNSRVVSITVLDEDKNEAANIANEIGKVYRDAVGPNGTSRPQIIDSATPALRPARPQKARSIGLGCAVGIIIIIAGAGLISRANKTIASPPKLPN